MAEQIEIDVKYAGYIDRQQTEIERVRRHEDALLPADFDYTRVAGLSNEVRAKLQEQGAVPGNGSAEDLGKFVQAEYARNQKIVQAANIKE